MQPPPVSLVSCSTICILLLVCCLSLSSLVYGQTDPFVPFDAYASSSVFVEGEGLYIAGGLQNVDLTNGLVDMNQAFKISLSVSWDTSRPTFESLMDSPYHAQAASARSSDGKYWIVYHSGTLYAYNFGTSTWQSFLTPITGIPGNISATTDPASGLMYFPNLSEGSMMRLNVGEKKHDLVPMPAALTTSRYFSVAWSAALGKMLFVGGSTETGQSTTMYSYNAQEGWIDLTKTMKGNIPSARSAACFVSASGVGSKMVLFGGFAPGRANVLSDIYVLDVATLEWTQGPDVVTTSRRAEAACGYSHDQFIAWGGRNMVDTVNTTVVFNIKNNQWTTLYFAPQLSSSTPSSVTVPSPTSSGAPPTHVPESNSSQTIVIVTVSLGVIAVALGGGIFFFLYRARRKSVPRSEEDASSKPPEPPASPDANDHHPSNAPSTDNPPGGAPQSGGVVPHDDLKDHNRRNPQLYTPSHPNAPSPQAPLPPIQAVWFPAPPILDKPVQGPQDHEALANQGLDSPTSMPYSMLGAPQEGAYGAARVSQHPHEMVNFMDIYSLPTNDSADVEFYDDTDMIPMNQIRYPV
ncbi:MAG: hypothetical protein J3Q66DRAFT_335153 [Benniella sp.]|nr:MAG: hypothetical protein J3Q66DRAFT_335153 [Benniella sp.]